MIRYKQWLCCVACEARSRWSSMRGLHFFLYRLLIFKKDPYMPKTFFTYEEQLEKLQQEKDFTCCFW